MDISRVLTYLRPDAQWSLNSNDYTSLVWHGPGDPPTLEELQAAWPDAQRASVIVTFRALAFALRAAGIYAQVKAAALSTEEGEIWWNTAQSTTVQRDHRFVTALGAAIGQTPEQLDALFAAAQTLDSQL
jgi:hypothetical protein